MDYEITSIAKYRTEKFQISKITTQKTPNTAQVLNVSYQNEKKQTDTGYVQFTSSNELSIRRTLHRKTILGFFFVKE